MAILKCKMCGGELTVVEGMSVCECAYCGSKQTIPNTNDEKRLKLYERANKLRFENEFDKAFGVYESIVSDYQSEAEAYWGLVLCKYGIEYVDDPMTGNKIPTCHRSSFDSVFDDPDFDLVMENADVVSRSIYREEAKKIEELRKSIIEVSSKEEAFDIFICYKETDETGQRTIDSVIAQDVYEKLIEKDYKVFFSRITLEDKLGQEYEPYIFAALNSAKVMLAFGTSYDYYNAVWVKNEWSRFLQLIETGQKKTLIPCYKNIDAYDMPKEFAHLQGQDMGKVGAIQDLLRGIDKIFDRDRLTTNKENEAKKDSNSNSLYKRGMIFLEESKWEDAEKYFNLALDMDPECAEAYLGLFLTHHRSLKLEDYIDEMIDDITYVNVETLIACDREEERINSFAKDNCVNGFLDESQIIDQFEYDLTYESSLNGIIEKENIFDTNDEWKRIERFADSDLLGKIKKQKERYEKAVLSAADIEKNKDAEKIATIKNEYSAFIDNKEKQIIEQKETASNLREARYKDLCDKFSAANNESDYKRLKEDFSKLFGYKESKKYIDECSRKIKEIEVERRDQELNKIEENRRINEKKKKTTRMIIIGITAILLVVLTISGVTSYIRSSKEQQRQIEEANNLMENGDYLKAIDAYYNIDNYDRSNDIDKCIEGHINNIKDDIKNKNYDEALAQYKDLCEYEEKYTGIKYDIDSYSTVIDICKLIEEIKNIDDGEVHNIANILQEVSEYSSEYDISDLIDNSTFDYVKSLDGEWKCTKSWNTNKNEEYLTGEYLSDQGFSIKDGFIKQSDFDWDITYVNGKYYKVYLTGTDGDVISADEIINYSGDGDNTFDVMQINGISFSYTKK